MERAKPEFTDERLRAMGLSLDMVKQFIASVSEELSALIHLPVAVADPLGGLDVNGALGGEDPHRHTVAAGLALGASS